MPVEETVVDLSCKDALEYAKALDPFLARSASTQMSDTESDSESASASSSDDDLAVVEEGGPSLQSPPKVCKSFDFVFSCTGLG